jgi:hypothetical protein
MFPNEMNIDLNVLCPSMMHSVTCHVYCQDVVAEGDHHTMDGTVEIAVELSKPYALSRVICHHVVLCSHA